MTDRERLICLLSDYDFDATFCNICERPDDDCAVCGSERLAEYLISNGVVAIPSKGCEYCKGRAYSKKPLTVTTIYGRTIKLPFDFCPKCGRRIKNDMKHGDKI